MAQPKAAMKNPRAGRELQEGLPGKTCGWTGNRLRMESQRGEGGQVWGQSAATKLQSSTAALGHR